MSQSLSGRSVPVAREPPRTTATTPGSSARASTSGSIGEFEATGGLERALLGIHHHVARNQVADGHELHALGADLDAVPDGHVLAGKPEGPLTQRVGVVTYPGDPAAASHE